MAPGPEAIAAIFGLWQRGHVVALLHEKLARSERRYAVQLLRPAFSLRARAAPGTDAASRSPAELLPVADAAPAALPAADGSPVSVVLMTSGSSGRPKAAGFARRAFAASAAGAARRLGLRSDDCWGLCLSLGHVGGLALLLRAVMTGCAVRCWSSFDADAVARAVVRGDVTHLSLVPVMLRRLLERLGGQVPSPRLRCVLAGGGASSPDLLARAVGAGLPVAPTWGMTETASQIATAPPDLARRVPSTVGGPLAGFEVGVAGDRVRPGRGRGVLAVRGPALASWVIRDPDTGPEPLPLDAEGWFRTADLGRIDDSGNIWVEGRHDEVIVSGGLNVVPGEVEAVIESMPGVTEAVVFGVPDDEWGELVAAAVEARGGAVTAESVFGYCRARMSRGRCPSRVEMVDSLPRTQTGKVMRHRVQAAARTSQLMSYDEWRSKT